METTRTSTANVARHLNERSPAWQGSRLRPHGGRSSTELWRQHHGAAGRLLPAIALPNLPTLFRPRSPRKERDPDMSVQPRHSLVRTRTMCAAFLMFAATALIPQVAAAGNTTICHVPPGNEANAHLINVSENAVPAHLSHGDFVATSCACQATAGASCGANQAPCCAGLKCVADVTGAFSCQEGTSSNPMPAGSACTSSTQCDPLYPCTSIGTNDSVCGG